MSDILSNFLSCNSTLNKQKYKNKFSAKLNKIFLENGLRLSKEGNMLQLPKLNINNRFLTENYKNKSYDNLENSIKNDHILIINNTDSENNNVFKNQKLCHININNNNTIQKKNKIYMHFNKYNNKFSKSNNNNKNRPKILTIDNNNNNNNIISEKEKAKKKFIDNYINSLLTKGKEKSDKFSEATKKIESNKFSLANSINPKMYIQKKILDESFNYNDFRTSRIQKDCFNGNEKFRKANYKNIKINLTNNLFLNSMSAPPEETRTKFLIDKMMDEQNHLNKFHFGKKVFNRKDGETINQNDN